MDIRLNDYKKVLAMDARTLKNLSDYAKIPNPCPATGNQGAITQDDIPTEVSPSFSSWHIADLSYGSGYHNLQLY